MERPVSSQGSQLYPLDPRSYSRAVASLASICRAPRLSRDHLRALQSQRLRAIVRHACRRVPHIQRRFGEAGIDPRAVRSMDDLRSLPIINKADLVQHEATEITAAGVDLGRCLAPTTSGSTGVPLTVYWDWPAAVIFLAVSARAHHLFGCRLRDRFLSVGLRSYPDDLLLQRLGLARVKRLPVSAGPEQIFAVLNRLKPDVLATFPSVLKSLLHAVPPVTPGHRPRIIVTSGEYLEDQTSAATEALLGSRPFQLYASWEMGRIGNQCQEGCGIHINEDLFIAELLPAAKIHGPDCRRLILTNLFNRVMPFIRYDQGDLVQIVPGPCPCGSPFQRIKILHARQSDVIRLPDGGVISVLNVAGILVEIPALRQFKCIQESATRLTLEIVFDPALTGASEARVIQQIVTRMQAVHRGMICRVNRVRHIDPDPSGKTMRFESRIGSGHARALGSDVSRAPTK